MLSLVTTFKQFVGDLKTIQVNALESWLTVNKGLEVIVVGHETGVDEVAREYDLILVKDVKRSPYGTPYLDDLLRRAEEIASYDYICLINGDIILLSDFSTAFHKALKFSNEFLMTSRRFDLPINYRIDFKEKGVDQRLRVMARSSYIRKTPRGTDLFLFRRGTFSNIPPFAIGRLVWSRWFIFEGLSKGIPVIDATPILTAIHQLHGYTHIKDGTVMAAHRLGLKGYDAVVKGKEYAWNLKIGGPAAYFSEEDCNYLLTMGGPIKRTGLRYLTRYMVKYPLINKRTQNIALQLYPSVLPSRRVRSVAKKILFKLKVLY
ncbi:MAG: hypothetical protein QXO15_03245 [Nitrososphaerota archaeon]